MNEIKITFAGHQGAGKTLLMREITSSLRRRGIAVIVYDDKHELHVLMDNDDRNQLGREQDKARGL